MDGDNDQEPVLRLVGERTTPPALPVEEPDLATLIGPSTGLRLARPVEPEAARPAPPVEPPGVSAPSPHRDTGFQPVSLSPQSAAHRLEAGAPLLPKPVLPPPASAGGCLEHLPCSRCGTSWPKGSLTCVAGKYFCEACNALETADARSASPLDAFREVAVVLIAFLATIAILCIVVRSGIVSVIAESPLGHLPETLGILGVVVGFSWLVVEAWRCSWGWGVYCLASPLLNVLVSGMHQSGDPLLSTLLQLTPTAIILFVINNWDVARKPIVVYGVGVLLMAGGFL